MHKLSCNLLCVFYVRVQKDIVGRMRTPVREAFSYGIRHGIRHIHCNSMKYDLILHWITMNMPYPVPYPVWKCLLYRSTHPPSFLSKFHNFPLKHKYFPGRSFLNSPLFPTLLHCIHKPYTYNCRCCYFQTPSVVHCMNATASAQSNNFCQLLRVTHKRSCTSAGNEQAQLHFRDDQQRAFGISNISN